MKIKINYKKILSVLLTSGIILCSDGNYVLADKNINDNVNCESSDLNYEGLYAIEETNFFNNSCLVSADLNVWLRKGPSTEYDKIDLIHGGDTLIAYGYIESGWYLVSYNGELGYAYGEYLTNLEEEKYYEETDGLYLMSQECSGVVYANLNVNFREKPDYKGKKIKVIKKGTKLELLGFENGWYKVSCNGKIGYVLSNYVSYDQNKSYRDDFKSVVYIENETFLMDGISNDSKMIYSFNKYEVCEVLGIYNDWYLVRYGELFGYVHRNCVNEVTSEALVVDIDRQKLTLYKNGDILVECDVVTGTKGVFDTPVGSYSIRNKVEDTNLVSEKYNYNRQVDYWMPFNGGIGFHDADWRNKFGGNVYVKNGSHGCVNIPVDYAGLVYDNISCGTKVLVHK